MKPLIHGALAVVCMALPVSAFAQNSITPTFKQDGKECRRYASQIRVGPGAADSYDTLCKQADGTWRKVDNGVSASGGVTSYGAQNSQSQSSTHIYSTHPDAATELVVEDNIPAYVVIDPYDYYQNRYKRGWSGEKRNFNKHHNGVGWKKHWKHHQKALGKD